GLRHRCGDLAVLSMNSFDGSCAGDYRQSNRCSRGGRRVASGIRTRETESVLRIAQADAVPAIARHLLSAAEREPDLARGDPGGEGGIRRAIPERDDDRVLHEDAAERAELGVDGAAELTDLHRVKAIRTSGRRRAPSPPV